MEAPHLNVAPFQAITVAHKLRSRGRKTDIVLEARKVKQSYSYADRVGAERAIFVAPDEWVQGMVHVKDLRRGPGKGLQGADAGSSHGARGEADNEAVVSLQDL